MRRDKQDIEAALTSKGFQSREGDHKYFVYWSIGGKKSMAKTKTSHGSGGDVGDDLLKFMARQCCLTKQEFLRLVDCPMDRDEYEKKLKESGKV